MALKLPEALILQLPRVIAGGDLCNICAAAPLALAANDRALRRVLDILKLFCDLAAFLETGDVM